MKYEFFEDKQFVTSKEGKYFIDLKEIPNYVINKLDLLGGIDVVNQGQKFHLWGHYL